MVNMLIVLPRSVLSAALAGGLLSGMLLMRMGLSPASAPICVLLFLLIALVASDFRYAASSPDVWMTRKIKSAIARLRGWPMEWRFLTALSLTVAMIALNVLSGADPRRDAYLSLATPIVVSALLFDFEAAAFAIFFTCAACLYFFIPPKFHFGFESWKDIELLGEFVAFDLLCAFVLKFVIAKAVAPWPFLRELAAESGGLREKGAGFGVAADDDRWRRRARALEAALAEKEALLREAAARHGELRHRIKNDLQTLYFLASVEARNAARPEEFGRLLLRLRSAAELHNALDGEGEGRIRMEEYLSALTQSLQNMFEGRFRIEAHVEPGINLDCRQAKSIGLIYCEAAMNAAKHAFSERSEGRLDVCFQRAEGGCRLIVADNGDGARCATIEPKFGLRLMQGLAESLNGVLRVDASPKGTTVCLRFAEAAPKRAA
jgi:two-component sensor histidine kinase